MNTIRVNGVELREKDVRGLIRRQRFDRTVNYAKSVAGCFVGDESSMDSEAATLTYVASASLVGKAGYLGEQSMVSAGRDIAEGSSNYMKTEFGTKEGLMRNTGGLAKRAALVGATFAALC